MVEQPAREVPEYSTIGTKWAVQLAPAHQCDISCWWAHFDMAGGMVLYL